MTAEGIRPSIFSGLLAAGAINDALAGDINALEKYTNAINEQWGTDMAWAQKLANTFYRFPKIGYNVGVKRPTAFQKLATTLVLSAPLVPRLWARFSVAKCAMAMLSIVPLRV